jgi:hypothetical protein
MPPLTLRRRVDIAGQLTVRCRAYLDIFEFYQDPATRKLIKGQMQDYYWFFKYEEHIYRFALIVKLTGLFTSVRKKPTVNFHALINDVRSKMRNADWNVLEALVLSAKPIVDKIEIIRNSALAHRSADLDFDTAFKKAGVTRNELKQLSEIALRAANTIAVAVGVPEVAFHSTETRRDMRKMFEALGSTFPKSGGAFEQLFGE